jgi:hypothetical protein
LVQHHDVLDGSLMTLITFSANKAIFRDGAIGTEQACCCETSPPLPDDPYGSCGGGCLGRVIVGDIDSEMAQCEDAELPEGWVLIERQGCDEGAIESGDVGPNLFVERSEQECGYRGLLNDERFFPGCVDQIIAGSASELYGTNFGIRGGYRSFARGGYTVLPNETYTNAWIYKLYNYEYDIGFGCYTSLTETCEVCGGQFVGPPFYGVLARLRLAVVEERYDPDTGLTYRAERNASRYLSESATILDIQPAITFSCEEMRNPEPLTICPDDAPAEGCVSVPLRPDPVTITVSLENGVTVNGVTFAWEGGTDEVLEPVFSPEEFPEDLTEPGGITIYNGERCCCFDENLETDYCNPLP